MTDRIRSKLTSTNKAPKDHKISTIEPIAKNESEEEEEYYLGKERDEERKKE